MTDNPGPASPSIARPQSPWGWAWLVLALAWVALVRVPMVLGAGAHLDSDLAVDGLTLIDALNGHWRWHYPATPFIGSPPVLLSWVQAKVWGPNPMTLASGGVVAYGLVVVGAYVFNRRAFGPSVAAWGLVPLAFASTGVIWLSGRVTGGHLLATAWHAGAFALLWGVLVKGGWRRSAALGLWCGFGLYLDSMFAVTWAGIGVAALVRAFSGSPLPLGEGPGVRDVASPAGSKEGDPGPTGDAMPLTPGPSPKGRGEEGGGRRIVRSIACLLAFGLASGLGLAPRVIGKRLDPHDAYVGQFEPVTRRDRVAANAGILIRDCLPRLVAGHRLPGLQAEPDPARLSGGSPPAAPAPVGTYLGLSVTLVAVGMFFRSIQELVGGPKPDRAGFAIRLGLLASSLAVVAGFLVHPSIANSDHYRYLVFLLVPWSSGFGLWMAGRAARGRRSAWLAAAMTLGFAGLMTADSARWYQGLGWLGPTLRPTRHAVEDPALAWLDAHPKVSTILGDYWDVYRVAFLTGGRVKAAPFPQYPDRFPEIRRELPGASHPVVIVRPGPFGPLYRARALRAGGRELLRVQGLSIVEWPGGLTP